MSTHVPIPNEGDAPAGATFSIVAAKFNAHLVDELLAGCKRRLIARGVHESSIAVHHVPGAFELPVAAKAIAIAEKPAAVICLGAVVRGDTPHFDFVAGETARGIQNVAIELALPVIFGVLTTNNEQQAIDRLGGSHGHAGEYAGDAAVDMAILLATL